MAGGGTGGHLFPALALAGEFRKRDKDAEITFVGGVGGIEERLVPAYGYPLRLLNVEGIKRKSAARRVAAIYKAFKATIQAIGILRAIRPDGVIGSGSYSSAPVVLAARLLGIKTAILEQNAIAGLTNRILGKMADRIYIAFEEARGYFPPLRTVVTGNPLREDIIGRIADKREKRIERNGGKFTVLVFGGSQGAKAVNAAFLDASEYLTDIWGDMRVIHQTGEQGYDQAEAAYKRKKMKVELHKFIDNMADAYLSADLAVCRAGATSISEITAFGLASILVPYPFAADDHQDANAMSLAAKGAAVVIRQDKLTGQSLAGAIRRLYENRKEFNDVSASAKAIGRPRAAEVIADNFLKILNPKSPQSPFRKGGGKRTA